MSFLSRLFPPDSLRRRIASICLRRPWQAPAVLAKSFWATYCLTGRLSPVAVFVGPGQCIRISRHRTTRVVVKGELVIQQWGGNRLPSSISLGEGSTFQIDGCFEIGPNVHLSVSKNASLTLGGRHDSSGSGITCDSRIMVEKRCSIGKDVIIAWGVFITDSDWHQIDGSSRQADVVIGDHVWVAHGASIMKGAHVPSGSIVAAKSLVSSPHTGNALMLAGTPAKVVRSNVVWTR